MEPSTFIFVGPSGSGKGTQVAFLKNVLNKVSAHEQFHFYTGNGVRSYMDELSETDSAKRSRQINKTGGLQPSFVAIWLWADAFIRNLRPDHHLLIDGSPRTVTEAWALDSALRFFERSSSHIVFIDVNKEESKRRLLERNRKDDTEQGINNRLSWYEERVKPAIDIFKNDDFYTFHHINGEQSPEDVHTDIVASLGIEL